MLNHFSISVHSPRHFLGDIGRTALEDNGDLVLVFWVLEISSVPLNVTQDGVVPC